MLGQPPFGVSAVVGAAVVADHRDHWGGGKQLVKEVAEHFGDVAHKQVVVPGAGGQVQGVVRCAFGDQAGPAPAGLFADTPVHRAQAHRRPAQPMPDAGGGPRFRCAQQGTDTLSHTGAAQPGTAAAWPVVKPANPFGLVAGDPAPHGVRVVLQQVGDVGGGHTVGRQQHHHRPGGGTPLLVQGGQKVVVLLAGQLGVHMRWAHTGEDLVG
jgi:hypothetical protein